MQFDLVTPEELLVSHEVTYVSVPGSEGSFGVLEGHQPTLSTLQPGAVEVEVDGETKLYYVGFGFVDVTAEKVTVLAEEAMAKTDIDAVDTESQLAAASDKLSKLIKSAGEKSDIEQLTRKVTCLEACLKLAKS
ncbi:MAG: F-type H+-transporting ATPase subunit epsilon [Alphaproteobacteria bacterium]|jgi:F-type H+-transporting ATPase subunit epsilon